MKILPLIVLAYLLSACADYQALRILKSQADIEEMRVDCLKRKQVDPTLDCSDYSSPRVNVDVKQKP